MLPTEYEPVGTVAEKLAEAVMGMRRVLGARTSDTTTPIAIPLAALALAAAVIGMIVRRNKKTVNK